MTYHPVYWQISQSTGTNLGETEVAQAIWETPTTSIFCSLHLLFFGPTWQQPSTNSPFNRNMMLKAGIWAVDAVIQKTLLAET